ncbi:MAG TPA: DUF167 domain-containing protein [Myxococcota bacterium]|jgi:uncharacterized protein (TIGR00251 family)|nr:DUF167 domain-containing protein [Myxococcota bacterium]
MRDGERGPVRAAPGGAGVLVDVLVAPRASKTRVMGVHDGRVKVALAAPPVDGAANDALVRLCAALLGVPRGAVRVSAGETSRRKTVAVAAGGLTPAFVLARLLD